ncbi:MAG: endonuclease/exonuclease/phosphatase family protein [Planctomycetota bacterium]
MILRLVGVLGACLLLRVATAESPPDQIRILSYNIHHGAGTDGQLDLPRIAHVIRSADPDVVMLQEVDRNARRSGSVDQAQRLASLTGMQSVFGGNIPLQGGQYGNAILTRLPITNHENHRLPNIDQGEQRGVLDATLWFFGNPLRVLCTHFDHRRDDRERIASAKSVNQLASQRPSTPTLLAGDINATRDSKVLNLLEQAWTIAGSEIPTIPARSPQKQIDFVFFRSQPNWKVIDVQVLDAPIASDHCPILAVLEWIEDESARNRRHQFRRDILALPKQDSRGLTRTSKTASNPSEWTARAASIRLGMETIMGRLPSEDRNTPPPYEIMGETDCGNYVRQEIRYESELDGQTPAYLCVPKGLPSDGTKKVPAILCLHPTDDRIGHDVVVGLGGKPNRQYASELAERGFVTLSPSYPLLAKYQPDLVKGNWKSGTLKAVWDNIRGIDLLQSLPYVDEQSIGAIGHSLGGHNAIYTAAHDERIRVIVSSCGLDSFLNYYDGDPAKWLPERGWTQTRYMPRLAQYRERLEDIPFDFHELIALLAPRHVMIVAPLHDSNFQVDSVRNLTSDARRVFSLHGLENHLVVRHPDCEHDFPTPEREAAYELFASVFELTVDQ